MQNLLQLKGDLKEAGPSSVSLKVGSTAIFMNETLDIMQRLTIKNTRAEVRHLNREYDNAAPAANPKHHEAEERKS